MTSASSLRETILTYGFASTAVTQYSQTTPTKFPGRCGECFYAYDVDTLHLDCSGSEWESGVLQASDGSHTLALDYQLRTLSQSAVWSLEDDETSAWPEVCAVVESFITQELGLVLCSEGSHVDFDKQCVFCKAVK